MGDSSNCVNKQAQYYDVTEAGFQNITFCVDQCLFDVDCLGFYYEFTQLRCIFAQFDEYAETIFPRYSREPSICSRRKGIFF